jgi:hypothetical protein
MASGSKILPLSCAKKLNEQAKPIDAAPWIPKANVDHLNFIMNGIGNLRNMGRDCRRHFFRPGAVSGSDAQGGLE